MCARGHHALEPRPLLEGLASAAVIVVARCSPGGGLAPVCSLVAGPGPLPPSMHGAPPMRPGRSDQGPHGREQVRTARRCRLQRNRGAQKMSGTQVANQDATGTAKATVDSKLEVVVIPVTDVDRAKRFYEGLGWRLDADVAAGDDFRIVQITPPASGCSI